MNCLKGLKGKKERTLIEVEKVLLVFKLFLMVWLVKKMMSFYQTIWRSVFFAFRAIVGLYKTVMMIGAYINATYYSSILYLIVSYTFVKCRLTICLVKGVSICWTNSKCTLPIITMSSLNSPIFFFHTIFHFHFHWSYRKGLCSGTSSLKC